MGELTDDEVLAFDANAAGLESKRAWLRLGQSFAAIVESSGDWTDTPSMAAEAMGWAAMAEACFWHATGDEDCAHVRMWVPALDAATRARTTGDG